MQTLPEDECVGFWLGKRSTACMTYRSLVLNVVHSLHPRGSFVCPRDSSIGTYIQRTEPLIPGCVGVIPSTHTYE